MLSLDILFNYISRPTMHCGTVTNRQPTIRQCHASNSNRPSPLPFPQQTYGRLGQLVSNKVEPDVRHTLGL